LEINIRSPGQEVSYAGVIALFRGVFQHPVEVQCGIWFAISVLAKLVEEIVFDLMVTL
jgi:hypothetical protein